MTPARLRLAGRLALRELRGGLRGFGVFLACLFLGVFAVSAVGSLASAARRGLAADARALLGGDLEISLPHREIDGKARAFLESRGTVSALAHLRAMVHPTNGSRPALAEVKGVDDAYPLYGEVGLSPAIPLGEALALRDGRRGAAADPELLRRLGISSGERLRIGEAEFEVRALLVAEPDRNLSAFSIAPHLLLSREGLAATGLLAPGSLVYHLYRVRLPQGEEAQPLIAELDRAFPSAGWRVRTLKDAEPRVTGFLDRMNTSLTLVGLAALLVGGLGVAGAVRAFLGGKLRHIAAMKCLGAEGRLLCGAYLMQILLLGALGTAAGLLAGALLPFAVAALAKGLLPLPLIPAVEPTVALAAAFGLLVALTFSLPALSGATRVAPAVLFRGGEDAPPRPGRRAVLVTALLALLLAALAVVSSGDRRLALWFVAGAGACFLALRGLAAALIRAAGRLRGSRVPSLRLAAANLRRPGAPGSRAVFSLGLGLTALVAVVLVQANLDALVRESLPREAPAFFFFDIQPAQADDFDRAVQEASPAARVDRRPTLRGRLSAIAGVPVEEARIAPEVSWAVRADRFLTYAAAAPAGTKLVAGEWWPADYAGPPLISLSADLAEGFGVGVGDMLTVNVLGREITAGIANVREVDWSSLALDFALIFAPGTLEGAPQTWIAAVRTPPGEEEAVYDVVTQRFANVSALPLKEVLANLSRLFGRIGAAFRLMAGIVLACGFLVLAGALAADQHRRLHDAVVFKVCGATRRDILTALAAEFLLVGAAAALLAAGVGTAAAWGVTAGVLKIDFAFRPLAVVLTLLGGLVSALVLGLAGTARVLVRKPAPYLRNE